MRTLLAQIYEQGEFWENAITQKRGLYNALLEHGGVADFDYLANDRPTLFEGFLQRIEYLNAELVFTQFHSADVLTVQQIYDLKARFPNTRFINWSGDSWSWSLTTPAILEFAKAFDIWLHCAPDVQPIYDANGIHAKFSQIAFEEPVLPLPDVPAYDIVFLGNVISEKRRDLLKFLRTLPYNVYIASDWEGANGHCTYDFARQRALYTKAKIAVADAAHVDQRRYVSDRPFTVMASGGAVLLHQRIDGLNELIAGIDEDNHYIGWDDFDSLEGHIWGCMHGSEPHEHSVQRGIVQTAKDFVYANHTWRNRVDQLIGWLGEL